jgi:hypothetical protein
LKDTRPSVPAASHHSQSVPHGKKLLWNKRGGQRTRLTLLAAVLYYDREIRGLSAVAIVELNHVFLAL